MLVAGAAAQQTMQINGAGATFPYPIYSKWFSEYNKLHPNVEINYQSIGSGGGIQQMTKPDRVLRRHRRPDDRRAAAGARRARSCTFPTVLGAVVPVYNIPDVTAELKFTGPVLADIFLGKITKWNDPAIAKLNAGVTLPATDITVVASRRRLGHDLHLGRLPGEGVAGVEEQGRRRHVGELADRRRRPGNEGVAGLVKQTPGAIGYVELIYALQNKIAYGSVQNVAGEFVKASVESVTAAAAEAAKAMPADFRVSITNAPGKGVYPISSFTWMLLYENPKDKAQAKTMVDFMKWALTDGQKFAPISATRRCPRRS